MYRLDKPKASAPIPKRESRVIENSMRLYSYFVCIAGLANYPQYTRMFRQNNICLTQIQEWTGISDKTIKVYLAILEFNGLIIYRGDKLSDEQLMEYNFNYEELDKYLKDELTGAEKRGVEKNIQQIWKKRNKEVKYGVYWIPRPDPYTPIPEITLEKLNKDFGASELEFKLYFLCCGYRDTLLEAGEENPTKTKALRYEDLINVLGKSHQTNNHRAIRHALSFLQGVGLIEYRDVKGANRKGGAVDSFALTEVHYYITKKPLDISQCELLTPDDIESLRQRIQKGYDNIKKDFVEEAENNEELEGSTD